VQLVGGLSKSDGESQIQAENEGMERWGFVEVPHLDFDIPDEISATRKVTGENTSAMK
jgi:hypothetical protein